MVALTLTSDDGSCLYEGSEPRPDGGNGEQEVKAKAVIAVAVAVKAREESKKQLAPAIKPLKYKL